MSEKKEKPRLAPPRIKRRKVKKVDEYTIHIHTTATIKNIRMLKNKNIPKSKAFNIGCYVIEHQELIDNSDVCRFIEKAINLKNKQHD